MKNLFAIVSAVVLLSGCSQFHVPPYSVNHRNVTELREIRDSDVKLAMGDVRGKNQAVTTLTCRAVGPVKTASGGTFGQYVKDALIAEMSIAEVYLADSDVKVAMNFNEFDFSSTSGEWVLAADVTVKDRTFPVKVTHNFSPSWFGETACDQSAQALMPAVQAFVHRLVTNQAFRDALKQ